HFAGRPPRAPVLIQRLAVLFDASQTRAASRTEPHLGPFVAASWILPLNSDLGSKFADRSVFPSRLFITKTPEPDMFEDFRSLICAGWNLTHHGQFTDIAS